MDALKNNYNLQPETWYSLSDTYSKMEEQQNKKPSNYYRNLYDLSICLPESISNGETGIICAQIALLSLAAADETPPTSDVLIRSEVKQLLKDIARKAMDMQCESSETLLSGAVESLQESIAKMYSMLYGECPPAAVQADEPERQKLAPVVTDQDTAEDSSAVSSGDDLMVLLSPYSDFDSTELNLPVILRTADEMEKLRLEIRLLREELAELLMERDHLLNYESRRIQSEFVAKFGELELQLSEAEFRMRQAKRKLALLQAQVNQQEPVNVETVEQTLRDEEKAFKINWDAVWEEIRSCAAEAKEHEKSEPEDETDSGTREENGSSENDSQNESDNESKIKSDELSPETQEPSKPEKPDIKTIYRKIVKALHPDTHPNQSEQEKELFKKAQVAYEDGELDTLLDILNVINGAADQEQDSAELLDTLKKEKSRLLQLIAKVRVEIEKIRSEPPFTLLTLLNDPVKVEERKNDLLDQIRRAKEATQIYEQKAEIIINGNGRKPESDQQGGK